MSLNHSFAGKKVLITGGGQGIGRQLVQRFHDDGAIVYTLDNNPVTIKKLREELPKVTAEIVDLTDWKSTAKIVESLGPFDHLVNNAAVLVPQNVLEITEEGAAKQYNVNVGAPINVTQTVAKGMIAAGSGGSVVNISSVAARKHFAGVAGYSASKAALEMLTKSMAVELGPHNIRVNCVLPGVVDAPMSRTEEGITQLAKDSMEKAIVKKLVETNEIVDLVMFLLSPLSRMIVGDTVTIDGGLSKV